VDVVVPVLVVLLLATLVVWFLLSPLSAATSAQADEHELTRRADLEAAREAKYREIREAELDRRTGKLDEGDWRVIDRQLRAEAVAILRELDELGSGPTRPQPDDTD
jgi:hypothetical protein